MAIVIPPYSVSTAMPKPGEIFIKAMGAVVIYGLVTEPLHLNHAPGWLILHDPKEPSVVGRTGRMEHGKPLIILHGVEARFSEADLQYGDLEQVPRGALILTERGPCVAAARGERDPLTVSIEGGVIETDLDYQGFWLPRWRLVRPIPGEEVVTMFEFGRIA